jgi:hypothetical protein
MAQQTRPRTLKQGAKFTDTAGKRHAAGEVVHLTLAQEWYFRDQLVPSGPSDPTQEPTLEQIGAREGREVISATAPAPAAAPAAPQGSAPAAQVPQAPAAPPMPPAPAQAAPEGGTAQAPAEAHPLHDLNVAEASAVVASAGTLEALRALEEAENRHPRHDGGRSGVKRAIETRRAELGG